MNLFNQFIFSGIVVSSMVSLWGLSIKNRSYCVMCGDDLHYDICEPKTIEGKFIKSIDFCIKKFILIHENF